ncbi:AAA domain-containing protein, partial [Kibdelosporangium lantanae]
RCCVPPLATTLADRPPLSTQDILELLRLLRTDTPQRRARATQIIPDDLPPVGRLAEVIEAERTARETSHERIDELTERLAAAREVLDELAQLGHEVRALLRRLGYGETETEHGWIGRAVGDRLAQRNAGLWGHLIEVRAEANRLQERLRAHGVTYVIEMPPVEAIGIGTARGWLNAGRALYEHLSTGGKIQRRFLPKTSVEKGAEDLLAQVRVDGRPPVAAAQLAAALERLEAEVAAAQLVEKWADTGVRVGGDRLTAILSQLGDYGDLLGQVEMLGHAQTRVQNLLNHAGVVTDLSTVERLTALLDRVPAAQRYVALERARAQVDEIYATISQMAGSPRACPELAALLTAIGRRDVAAYEQGMAAVETARTEQARERRRGGLAQALRSVHPQLFDLLDRTAIDQAWDSRLADLPAAWAWSKAFQYVAVCRNTDEERRLTIEFDQIEDQVRRVTEELAATEAMRACLDRMTDQHSRALNSYREHMSHVGAGTGKKTSHYRRAARAAMEKAKDAVPAWVVPLPDLLTNISATHNAFDVVIVDEASQVSVEHLYLLWMAPRVIVVGDDKQCTPGGSQMSRLDDQFKSLDDHLAEIEPEIRMNFTSKSNLYGLLSARSGKNSIVRLREHFRCMPEIINWSSSQFYGDTSNPGLVPLRERTARDLDPLRVVRVTGAITEGRDTRLRNPTEAKHIVDTMVECLNDPRYRDKTFGVVVLRSGASYIQLLEHEINLALTPEQRQQHKIRVGTAPNFQGDERDVIFLSTVVAQTPNLQASTLYQQSYNVASTRAKDQMWLFTSLSADQLKPGDLRASLIEYMRNPPSVYGVSPDLDAVSPTEPCAPFESLFEQRVFREIRRRGYHVVPQYRVGTRRLDLVVVG